MKPQEPESPDCLERELSAHNQPTTAKVQCPNCCRLAPVTGRNLGLLFFRCELCGTSGATPEEHQLPTPNSQLPTEPIDGTQ